MVIDANSHVPIFEQIAGSIRTGIAAGVYQPGEALPSLRALALELTVNPNTVKRAYEILEREGLVVSRRGVGLFVADDAVEIAKGKASEAVEALFAGAVTAAKACGLVENDIRGTFEKAMRGESTNIETRNPKQ